MGKFYDSKDPKGFDDVNGDNRQALDSFSGDNFHIHNLRTGTGVQNNNDGGGQQNVNYWTHGGTGPNNDDPPPYAFKADVGSSNSSRGGFREQNFNNDLLPRTHALARDWETKERRELMTLPPLPNAGQPLTPKELARKENVFKQLIDDPAHYEQVMACEGYDAQRVLDNWQLVRFKSFFVSWTRDSTRASSRKMIECTRDRGIRTHLMRSMLELSSNSGLFPQCLEIKGVEGLRKGSAYGGYADICTGKFNGMKVAVKVVHGSHDSLKRERAIKAKGIAQGIAYLHDLQITHGDIKGANVLITPEHTACITDFGLSRITDSQKSGGLSNMTHELGPARWRAPELLKYGRSAMSPASDVKLKKSPQIYAKRIPFVDFTEYGVYNSVVMEKRTPEPPPETPYEMRQLMEECWRAEPGGRPKAARIVERIGGMEADRPGLYVPEGILVDI
ncbi:hypothetical protein AAF712_015089 [Marasmius tenuissimus]|uniref:Protein kinase domain-containing protein n=1 Tax=Marasmius tenuissimus TaxID=585030 RepID=A0ABR2ZA61_9AGAR